MKHTKHTATAASVAARFSAAASTYDEQSGVQRAVAERLVATMMGDEGTQGIDRILEVGCGTGTLTELLVHRFPGAVIDAVDISEAMVEHARKRMSGICGPGSGPVRLHACDARTFSSGESYPLIVGSSALHWMVPLADTARRLTEQLEPEGRLVAAVMVEGTFEELHAARLRTAPEKPVRIALPSVEDVVDAVSGAGLTVTDMHEEFPQARYESAAAFLKSLNRQGVTGATMRGRLPLNRTELARLISDYDRHYSCPSGGVIATSRVLYLSACFTAKDTKSTKRDNKSRRME